MKRLLVGVFCVLGVLACFPIIASTATVLEVPFVVQAPHTNWAQPYQDACEEAVIVMLDAWYEGDKRKKMPANEADERIIELVDLENRTLGYNRDTNLATMARLINDYYPFEAYVIENPTVDDIKGQIDAGLAVVLPVWGRKLYSNPHFTYPGPTYHTVLVIGYDDVRGQFITHEPGTRRGKAFRYKYTELMNAMNDFIPGSNGLPIYAQAKRALFVRFDLLISADSDADRDGLVKQQELAYGTSLIQSDTDGDGFFDGKEVQEGFSPHVNEHSLNNGALIKTASDPRVWLLDKGLLRHVESEEVFEKSGFKWNDIVTVSSKFMKGYKQGTIYGAP